MTVYIGRLGTIGIAKDNPAGTFTAPTEFLPVHLPCTLSPDIALLESAGIGSVPDAVIKVGQGAGMLKGGKIKFDLEPENCGNHLMGAFGTDTMAEVASFTVVTGTNDKIDFKDGAGGAVVATIAAGTYTVGTSSSQAGTLCALIKTAMDSAGSLTHTVTYSYTTKLMTIAVTTSTWNHLGATGGNAAKSLLLLTMGFAAADSGDVASLAATTPTAPVFGHTFTRLSAAQLPSYSLWQKSGLNYITWAGCQAAKQDLDLSAGGWVTLETEWAGSTYASGTTASVSYSALKPFKFNQAVLTIGGSGVTSYESIKLSIDNMVKVTPVLGGSIYSSVVASEGMKVTLAATLLVDGSTEWDKFIAGTSSSFVLALTSAQLIKAGFPYSLTYNLPEMNYSAAPLGLDNGLIKIAFVASGVYNVATTKTLNAVLRNTVGTAY